MDVKDLQHIQYYIHILGSLEATMNLNIISQAYKNHLLSLK